MDNTITDAKSSQVKPLSHNALWYPPVSELPGGVFDVTEVHFTKQYDGYFIEQHNTGHKQ